MEENQSKQSGVFVLFEWVVMFFSASMTVYSLYDAFDGGVMGWIFGFAGVFIFEGAAMYWQHASKIGREGQISVANRAQWATMGLSLISTLVGIALLTEWGSELRSAVPLGAIMIALIGAGLGVDMFSFIAFKNEEPEAKRLHRQRMLQAAKARLVWMGDMRALAQAEIEMEKKIDAEAPKLGASLADDGMVTVRAHNAPTQLPAPRQSAHSPWQVEPAVVMGGGHTPAPARPHQFANAPQPGMNHKPPTLNAEERWLEDDETVDNRPTAPKGQPRETGVRHNLSERMTYRVQKPEVMSVPEAVSRRLSE